MENMNMGEEKKCCSWSMCHRHSFKIVLSVLGLVLVVFVVALTVNAIKESSYIGKGLDRQDVITVSGTGEIFLKPDVAKIYLSVVKEASTVIEAQTAHSEVINKVVKYLKDNGIEERDIKTSSYNVFPKYNYTQTRGQVFMGYEISQTLEVKVRKIDEAGKIIGGATEAGSNQVGGVNFSVDDEDLAKRQARQEAINDAKEKARSLAKDLDVRLGELVSFSESNGGVIYPMYGRAESALDSSMKSAPSPELPAGENKITVNVSLTYEIK